MDDTKILYNSGREALKAKRLLLPLPFRKRREVARMTSFELIVILIFATGYIIVIKKK